MPVFDYRCSDCGITYDVYHKVKEIPEDVVCPDCGSANYRKLISAASVTIGSKTNSSCSSEASCEADGGCCGGACNLN